MMIIDGNYQKLGYRYTTCKLKRQLLPKYIIEILSSIISDDCSTVQSSWSYSNEDGYYNTQSSYGQESLQALESTMKDDSIHDIRCFYRVKRGEIIVKPSNYGHDIAIGYKPDIVDDNLIPDEITQFIDYLREFDEQPEPDRSKKAP